MTSRYSEPRRLPTTPNDGDDVIAQLRRTDLVNISRNVAEDRIVEPNDSVGWAHDNPVGRARKIGDLTGMEIHTLRTKAGIPVANVGVVVASVAGVEVRVQPRRKSARMKSYHQFQLRVEPLHGSDVHMREIHTRPADARLHFALDTEQQTINHLDQVTCLDVVVDRTVLRQRVDVRTRRVSRRRGTNMQLHRFPFTEVARLP